MINQLCKFEKYGSEKTNISLMHFNIFLGILFFFKPKELRIFFLYMHITYI